MGVADELIVNGRGRIGSVAALGAPLSVMVRPSTQKEQLPGQFPDGKKLWALDDVIVTSLTMAS